MSDQATIRAAIKQGALRRLGVLDAGQSAGAADDALADGALTRLVGHLAAEGSARFHDQAIPEQAQHGLIVLLAATLADDFGLAEERAQRLLAQAEAERRLLRQQAGATAGEPTPFQDF